MGDFFKGWRRKFAVVTLVMACLFMGAWFKSFTHFCKLSFATGKMSYCEISSQEGSIKAEVFYNNDPELSRRRFVFQNFGDLKLKGWADVLWFALERPRDDDVFPDYKRGWGGFRFKNGMERELYCYLFHVVGIAMPHLTVVILFSLMSTVLFFSRPPVKTASTPRKSCATE